MVEFLFFSTECHYYIVFGQKSTLQILSNSSIWLYFPVKDLFSSHGATWVKLGYVQRTVTSALYDSSKIIIAYEATSKTVRKRRNFLSATSNLHNLYLPVTLTRTLLWLDPMSFVAMHTIFSWSSPNCIELVVNVFLSSENIICMLIGWKRACWEAWNRSKISCQEIQSIALDFVPF